MLPESPETVFHSYSSLKTKYESVQRRFAAGEAHSAGGDAFDFYRKCKQTCDT